MTLSVQNYPKFRSIIPSTGEPNNGGWVYTYETGTLIKQPTYADAQGITENANPTQLDSNGEAFIWILNTNDAAYDFVIKDSNHVELQTMLDIQQVAIVNNNVTFSGNLPIDNNSIIDSNDKKYIKFTSAASAANWITVTNSATGSGPITGTAGGDANVDYNITTKGTGVIGLSDVSITKSVGSAGPTIRSVGTNRDLNLRGSGSGAVSLSGLKYPTADGSTNEFLITDGSGNIGFTSISVFAVSEVDTGTGLTGGPITSTGTISLANTAVTPSTYGDATHVAQITVDAQGRLTSATNVAISGGGGGGASVASISIDGSNFQMYDTPILVLPASAGNAYIVLSATLFSKGVIAGSNWSAGGNIILQQGSAPHGAGVNTLSASWPATFLTTMPLDGGVYQQVIVGADKPSSVLPVNTGLYLSNQTANFVLGSASAVLYISYYIVSSPF